MKAFNQILGILAISILSACGGSSGGGAVGAVDAGGGSTHSTWKVVLSGDNVSFALTMVANQGQADEDQLVVGPVAIPAGGSLTYEVEGDVFSQGGVSRVSGPMNNLQITFYKNGVATESATLTTNGTFHTFTNF